MRPSWPSCRTRGVRRGLIILSLLAGLAAAWDPPASGVAAGASPGTCRPVKVMTWNLYLGADLRPVLAPQTLAELAAAATRVSAELVATDFPRRAETIADAVRRARPDLIGLQEAELWRIQSPSDPTSSATDVRYDFVEILREALAARGLEYVPVSTVTNADFEAPTLLGLDLRVTDRDVILERVGAPGVTVANPMAANFLTNLTLPNPLDPAHPVVITRGWTSVDVQLQGCEFRLVDTHLDGDSALVQGAQALEILAGPANPLAGPVMLVGDFNSRADGTGTPTYAGLLAAGLTDAWSQARGASPGYTCCHDAAALLRNPFDTLTGRIDLVLTRGGQGLAARRFGTRPAEWMKRRIWPSDHAGVAALVRFGHRRR